MKTKLGLKTASVLLCALALWGCGDENPPEEGDDGAQPPDADQGVDASTSGTASSKDAGIKTLLDAKLPTSAAKALPCEIETIVDAHCGTCHGANPAGGVPMSLVTADDFQAAKADGQAMHALVNTRISASDPTKRMPPTGYKQLAEGDLATMKAWLDKGAPAGTDKCAAKPAVDAGAPKDALPPIVGDGDLECYKLLAHNGDGKSKYAVGAANDAYIMYVFAAPWKETVYGIVIRPIIDNAKVLHHWLLFEDDVAGVPLGPSPEVGAHPTGQLIAGWAPGAESTDFRLTGADVGFELPGNTTYTVEFHYNSSDLFAEDQSGVEVCAIKRKPKEVAAISWLGLDQLLIPSTKWTGTCRPTSQEPIHITHVWPHMHLTGRHMKSVINRKNGDKEVLHDEDFDFNYQRAYRKDVTLMPGDTITTVCDYSQPMSFGESTKAEMCYLFTTAYPKGALAGFDIWGTFAHGGSSCLGM
jgi:mono/diheme cytochrome c family protein